MSEELTKEQLEVLILDICDGLLREPGEIQYYTGFSFNKSTKLASQINKVFAKYKLNKTTNRWEKK